MTDLPDQCVFCAIITGVVPCHAVYEDERTLAFLDISPATAGHTLVVPKVHADDLFDIGADDAVAVIRTVKRVAMQIDEHLSPHGLTVAQTNRSAGWQDVFHFHVHVVPRWDDDDLVPPWSPHPGDPDDLERIAALIRVD